MGFIPQSQSIVKAKANAPNAKSNAPNANEKSFDYYWSFGDFGLALVAFYLALGDLNV